MFVYNSFQVAAGMQVTIQVEIFAVAVGVEGNIGVGQVSHHVEIVTETDILYVPIIASILFIFGRLAQSVECSPRQAQTKRR